MSISEHPETSDCSIICFSDRKHVYLSIEALTYNYLPEGRLHADLLF